MTLDHTEEVFDFTLSHAEETLLPTLEQISEVFDFTLSQAPPMVVFTLFHAVEVHDFMLDQALLTASQMDESAVLKNSVMACQALVIP